MPQLAREKTFALFPVAGSAVAESTDTKAPRAKYEQNRDWNYADKKEGVLSKNERPGAVNTEASIQSLKVTSEIMPLALRKSTANRRQIGPPIRPAHIQETALF